MRLPTGGPVTETHGGSGYGDPRGVRLRRPTGGPVTETHEGAGYGDPRGGRLRRPTGGPRERGLSREGKSQDSAGDGAAGARRLPLMPPRGGAYQLVTSLTWCGYLVMAARTRWRRRDGT